MMQTSSISLVEDCLAGDQSAWTRLIEEFRGLVYSICLPFAASHPDAEDMVQDTFVKVWNHLPSFNPAKGELKSWIATIARNQRVDRYRRNAQQRATQSLDEGWDQPETMRIADRLADDATLPDAAAASQQVAEIVTRAIEGVAPEMREVVKLRFLFDMDNQEIAIRLHIPEGTVKSRTSRGRAQLAALLTPMRTALGAA